MRAPRRAIRSASCARSASTSCSSPRTAPRSSRSSSSAAAASTRSPSRTGDCPAPQLPERARRLERAGAAGSTSRASVSSARRRASPSRRPRCSAPTSARPGVTTVVIDAEQMQLQVHESVGHPDRARPRLRHRGRRTRARASSSRATSARCATARSMMNITADSTTPRGLGTFGWDDEGVPARREPIVAGGRPARVPDLARDRGADRRGRRRLDARRRLEPDAARPDDEPPPRAGRGLVRGAARGRGRRDLPGDEQELVDRRQAAQLPVRDADRVGDQGRQARPDAARRDLHRRHARVLGLARRGRRPGRVAAARG